MQDVGLFLIGLPFLCMAECRDTEKLWKVSMDLKALKNVADIFCVSNLVLLESSCWSERNIV